MLVLVQSKDVVHGPIECLFTADEETTMDGAAKVDRSLLQSEVLINVDSEEEHSVCMGCAGGFEKYLRLPVVRDAALSGEDFVCLRVFLQGLLGGHTGACCGYWRVASSVLMCLCFDGTLPRRCQHRDGSAHVSHAPVPDDCC